MKNTDKFLIGIVAGIVLLVIVAFVITITRPAPTYQDENTPKGVAHNYLLALQERENARAYGYLSPSLDGYPASEDEFIAAVQNQSWQFRRNQEVTLAVEAADVTGGRAVVTIRESSFRGGGLFDSFQSTSTFEMQLRQEAEGWKIVDAEAYFAWCWKNQSGCK